MYLYYFLAALGPKIQPYLWWKRYLTVMQMGQFVLIMLHTFQLLFIDCDFPKIFVWWIGMHAIMFYFLFRNFYNEAYTKKPKGLKNVSDRQKNDKKELNVHKEDLKENENEKGVIYANQYKMATGYISDSGLRNRVFIDNRGYNE
jgi:elongation of very long chain fatty acids protein 7